MEVCARGATGRDVLDALTRTWPGTLEDTTRGMVLQVVRHGFLLTDLTPPTATTTTPSDISSPNSHPAVRSETN
ncbi:hypothetical protein GCM10020001_113400 [Nonomuraea salmonea]